MSKDSQLISLNAVFTDNLYRIPDYQRGYAWGKNQLEDFWEDLVNLPDNSNHYIGMISVERVSRDDWESWVGERSVILKRDYSAYYVVDGQQRLTTFVLFIKSFVDLFHLIYKDEKKEDRDIEIDGEPLDRIIDKYLYSVDKKNQTLKAYKFGYVDSQSYNYLKKEILGCSIAEDVEETFYTCNLGRAKSFFDYNLKQYYSNNNLEALECLFTKAVKRFKFMIHYIEDDFDVYAAFETMNNRGKKLSYLELLKSRLIYLTTLFSKDQITDDERETLRENINSAWKKIYKWLGRKKDVQLNDDEFLRDNWILQYQYSSKRGNNFNTFLLEQEFIVRNVINVQSMIHTYEEVIEESDEINSSDDIENDSSQESSDELVTKKQLTDQYITNYVLCLGDMAEHWFYSHYPEYSTYTDEEKRWLTRLNHIKMAYFRPLIVASFMRSDISSEDRVILLKEIDRFILLAFRMCGAYETYYRNDALKMVWQLYNNKLPINKVVSNIHNKIENWVNAEKEFNIKPFISRIQRLYSDGDGYYAWGALRYVLYEYEQKLKEESKGMDDLVPWKVEIKHGTVSIEHIYPQNPEESSSWITLFSDYNDEQKKYLRGSIGNLLLLGRSKNSKLQNDDYEYKKNGRKKDGVEIYKGYDRGSYSETEVATSYSSWTAESILKRGINLLDFMEDEWNIHFKDEYAKKEVLFLDFVSIQSNNN